MSIQRADFDVAVAQNWLDGSREHGAIVTFTGVVRDITTDGKLSGLLLEEYPGMTRAAIERLVDEATRRFSLMRCFVIHRVGHLAAHENIVFVGVASKHRKAAFDANQFIMDKLKRDIPIWKKELFVDGREQWVEAKKTDLQAADSWD